MTITRKSETNLDYKLYLLLLSLVTLSMEDCRMLYY